MNLQSFFPEFSDIGPFDECIHIHKGLEMISTCHFPELANRPAIALLYAAIFPFVQSSSSWLLQSCIIGRWILFTLVSLSVYAVAINVKKHVHPALIVMVFCLTPCLQQLLKNPADALFSGFSGLTFAFLHATHAHCDRRRLFFASVMAFFACLARTEGVLLLLPLVVLALKAGTRGKHRLESLAYALLPFVVLLCLAVFLNGDLQKNIRLLRIVSYFVFEQGHSVLVSDASKNVWTEGMLIAREKYGAPDVNYRSAAIAILHNLPFYVSACFARLAELPKAWALMYGGTVSVFTFLFSLGGLVEILSKPAFRREGLLFILWPLLLSPYILFSLRLEMLAVFGYWVAPLTALGIRLVMVRSSPKISLGLVAVVAGGLAFVKGARLAALTLLCFLSAKLVPNIASPDLRGGLALGTMASLKIAMDVSKNTAKNSTGSLVPDAQNVAMLYLQGHFRQDERVAAYSPKIVMGAKLQYVSLNGPDGLLADGSMGLAGRFRSRNVVAVVVDRDLELYEPDVAALLDSQLGLLTPVFDQGGIKILRFNPNQP